MTRRRRSNATSGPFTPGASLAFAGSVGQPRDGICGQQDADVSSRAAESVELLQIHVLGIEARLFLQLARGRGVEIGVEIEAQEAACDELLIQRHVTGPADYGRFLVTLAQRLPREPRAARVPFPRAVPLPALP